MYYFYLDKMLLPITPSKLTTKINNANETVTLINEGEVNLLKTAGLTDIDFECTIPQVRYPFANYSSGFLGASVFLNYFEKLKTDKQPFSFIVCRLSPAGKVLFSTSMMVSLEDYKITEQATNGMDLTVSISLKQYRGYGSNKVQVKATSAAAMLVASIIVNRLNTSNSPSPKSSQKYKVKAGDTLYTIAKHFYNDGSKYKKIQSANSSITDPNNLTVGQSLTIPAA